MSISGSRIALGLRGSLKQIRKKEDRTLSDDSVVIQTKVRSLDSVEIPTVALFASGDCKQISISLGEGGRLLDEVTAG